MRLQFAAVSPPQKSGTLSDVRAISPVVIHREKCRSFARFSVFALLIYSETKFLRFQFLPGI
jgi:hypothetical protein